MLMKNKYKLVKISQPHLSLSATKMTLRSNNSEAKTRITCRTLRQLNRLSKSTCSSLESVGRLSSMTWETRTNCMRKIQASQSVLFTNKRMENESGKNWIVAGFFFFSFLRAPDLVSSSRQEGLHFDYLPWCREGRLHQTPHEGINQGCRDASPPLHLVQDLNTAKKGKSRVRIAFFNLFRHQQHTHLHICFHERA